MKINKYSLHKNIVLALVFLNTFLVSSTFRGREFGSNDVDFQIFLKLGLSVLSFAYVIFVYRVWIGRLLKIDNIFCALMLVWFAVSALYAPSIIYSLAAAFTFMSITFTFYMSSSILDTKQIIRAVIWGCTVVTIISLIVYFVNPDFGRMKEWQGGVRLPGKRLTGITGTANAIGYLAAFACLAIVSYRLYLDKAMPKIYYALLVLNLIAQIMSNSRTSMIAAIFALGVTTVMKKPQPWRLAAIFLGLCSLIIFMGLIDINELFASLSRTGDASEITTGTGRTEIWSETIEMIAQRPILGWGYASSGYYMPAFHHSSPHAHNMVLQIWFTTGIIGLCLALPAIFIKAYYSIKFKDYFKLTLIFFLLIQGLTEPSAFQGVASMATIVFAIAMSLKYVKPYEDSE